MSKEGKERQQERDRDTEMTTGGHAPPDPLVAANIGTKGHSAFTKVKKREKEDEQFNPKVTSEKLPISSPRRPATPHSMRSQWGRSYSDPCTPFESGVEERSYSDPFERTDPYKLTASSVHELNIDFQVTRHKLSAKGPTRSPNIPCTQCAPPFVPSYGSITKQKTRKTAKRKATIGLIGIHAKNVALLNKLIVEVGNEEMELGDDQEHPVVCAVAIQADAVNPIVSLERHARICRDFGCDLIGVAAQKGQKEGELSRFINEKLGVEAIINEGDSEDELRMLAWEILNRSIELGSDPEKEPRLLRPNLIDYDKFAKELSEKLLGDIKEDSRLRDERITATEKIDKGIYKALKEERVTGILGGAGPNASCKAMIELVDRGVGVVHISENWTPGKHRSEMKIGPRYEAFYENIIRYFEKIGVADIVIPCNTAHKRCNEYCSQDTLRRLFRDYREIALEALAQARAPVGTLYSSPPRPLSEVATENKVTKIILLGTHATVGIGTMETGIYEAKRKEMGYDNIEFVTPSEKRQELIMKAIYLVKEGKMEKAMLLIDIVIAEIRLSLLGNNESKNESIEKIIELIESDNKNAKRAVDLLTLRAGNEPKVLLACTELPLPYGARSNFMTAERNLIDPTDLMAELIHKLHNSVVVFDSDETESSDCEEEALDTNDIKRSSDAWIYREESQAENKTTTVTYRIITMPKEASFINLKNVQKYHSRNLIRSLNMLNPRLLGSGVQWGEKLGARSTFTLSLQEDNGDAGQQLRSLAKNLNCGIIDGGKPEDMRPLSRPSSQSNLRRGSFTEDRVRASSITSGSIYVSNEDLSNSKATSSPKATIGTKLAFEKIQTQGKE